MSQRCEKENVLPGWQGEVNKCDFGRDLRRIVWVWQIGGHVQCEAFMVGDDWIAQFKHCAALLLKCLEAINVT